VVVQVPGYLQALILLGFDQLVGEKLHLVLGLFSLGDIDPDAQDFNDPAGFIPDRLIGPGNPGPRSVPADIFDFIGGVSLRDASKSPSSGSDSPALRMSAME
jgi:hypothetical protein